VIRRFYRGDQSPNNAQQAQSPGSGLGLAIAHEIMMRLGGKLQITTASSGQGTRIVLTCSHH
jgi:signal transduction histidine kinase